MSSRQKSKILLANWRTVIWLILIFFGCDRTWELGTCVWLTDEKNFYVSKVKKNISSWLREWGGVRSGRPTCQGVVHVSHGRENDDVAVCNRGNKALEVKLCRSPVFEDEGRIVKEAWRNTQSFQMFAERVMQMIIVWVSVGEEVNDESESTSGALPITS